MDLKSTYNKIAEDWFADHHQDSWWREGVDKFLSNLPKGASILDVGCGAGVKSRYLAAHGFNITGIDFSEKMIGIAKREAPEILFEIVDVYELDTYNKKFDAVFAQAFLLRIPKNKARQVLEKLKSKINPGGLLYIAVKGVRTDGIEEKVIKENDYGYAYERFFSFFKLPELKNYLEELNMEVIWEAVNNSGVSDWIQIIGRKR